jgi:DNA mismatch endonuclease (patch repair protein)
VVFVHGCFWHRHDSCQFAYTPKSRVSFWNMQFRDNLVRDEKARQALDALGWSVVTVWECETADVQALERRLGAWFHRGVQRSKAFC